MAMNVLVAAFCRSPWMLLVATELAITPPAICLLGRLSATRSSNCVLMRLNAVVCELAMLPEMFCSANDCALRPETAVVRASKIPMTCSPLGMRTRTTLRTRRPQYAGVLANPVPELFLCDFNILQNINDLEWQAGRRISAWQGQDLPRPGSCSSSLVPAPRRRFRRVSPSAIASPQPRQ